MTSNLDRTARLTVELAGKVMPFAGMNEIQKLTGLHSGASSKMMLTAQAAARQAQLDLDKATRAFEAAETRKQNAVNATSRLRLRLQQAEERNNQQMAERYRLAWEQAEQKRQQAFTNAATARSRVEQSALRASQTAGSLGTTRRLAVASGILNTTGNVALAGGVAGTAALAYLANSGMQWQSFLAQTQSNTTLSNAQIKQIQAASFRMAAHSGIKPESFVQAYRYGSDMGLLSGPGGGMGLLNNTVRASLMAGAPTGANVQDVMGVISVIGKNFPTYRSDPMAIANMLLRTSQGSRMDLGTLVQSLPQTLSIAGHYGAKQLPQVLAAFAALTSANGGNADEANTQLYNLMARIATPTPAVTKALAALKTHGVDLTGDFSAAGLQSKGLAGVLGDIHQANLNPADLRKLFPYMRAYFGALGLTGNQSGSFLNLLNNPTTGIAAAPSQNPVGANYARYLKLDATKLKEVNQQLDIMTKKLGTALLPELAQLEKDLLPVVNSFSHWTQNNRGTVKTLIEMAPYLLAVGGGLKVFVGLTRLAGDAKLASGIARIGGAFGGVSKSLSPLVAGESGQLALTRDGLKGVGDEAHAAAPKIDQAKLGLQNVDSAARPLGGAQGELTTAATGMRATGDAAQGAEAKVGVYETQIATLGKEAAIAPELNAAAGGIRLTGAAAETAVAGGGLLTLASQLTAVAGALMLVGMGNQLARQNGTYANIQNDIVSGMQNLVNSLPGPMKTALMTTIPGGGAIPYIWDAAKSIMGVNLPNGSPSSGGSHYVAKPWVAGRSGVPFSASKLGSFNSPQNDYQNRIIGAPGSGDRDGGQSFYRGLLGGHGTYTDTDFTSTTGRPTNVVLPGGPKAKWTFVKMYVDPTGRGGVGEIWKDPQGHEIIFWHMGMDSRNGALGSSAVNNANPHGRMAWDNSKKQWVNLQPGHQYRGGTTVGQSGYAGGVNHLCIVTDDQGRTDLVMLTGGQMVQLRNQGYNVREAGPGSGGLHATGGLTASEASTISTAARNNNVPVQIGYGIWGQESGGHGSNMGINPSTAPTPQAQAQISMHTYASWFAWTGTPAGRAAMKAHGLNPDSTLDREKVALSIYNTGPNGPWWKNYYTASNDPNSLHPSSTNIWGSSGDIRGMGYASAVLTYGANAPVNSSPGSSGGTGPTRPQYLGNLGTKPKAKAKLDPGIAWQIFSKTVTDRHWWNKDGTVNWKIIPRKDRDFLDELLRIIGQGNINRAGSYFQGLVNAGYMPQYVGDEEYQGVVRDNSPLISTPEQAFDSSHIHRAKPKKPVKHNWQNYWLGRAHNDIRGADNLLKAFTDPTTGEVDWKAVKKAGLGSAVDNILRKVDMDNYMANRAWANATIKDPKQRAKVISRFWQDAMKIWKNPEGNFGSPSSAPYAGAANHPVPVKVTGSCKAVAEQNKLHTKTAAGATSTATNTAKTAQHTAALLKEIKQLHRDNHALHEALMKIAAHLPSATPTKPLRGGIPTPARPGK